ncbi:hypothetical protein BDN72DRAFT_784476 [Pluteus cervinus]|uniref:Uncharacterized protein n=1 Tax=Pluteus cervinus TaxID=181527 RepID=A0ACD3BHQ1_9AGAR|nr:hypothetical protein BDN72DRAFT_784476 [Pluteus cervinus]
MSTRSDASEIRPSLQEMNSTFTEATASEQSFGGNPISGTQRSMKSMRGLLRAEVGDSMVELDPMEEFGFRDGHRISLQVDRTPRPGTNDPGSPAVSLFEHVPLARIDTLLTTGDTRSSGLLKSLMGNSTSRLKPGSSVVVQASPRNTLALEQAKRKAKVKINLILESDICVQGGVLRGNIVISIRNNEKSERPVLISGGRLRIIGFESISRDDRHIFYQCASSFQEVTDLWQSLYATEVSDFDTFSAAREGDHSLPFAIKLPLTDEYGKAKGVTTAQTDIGLRYIVMASLKVQDPDTGAKSIAHFYRNCEIWPRLNPSEILAPAPRPLRSTFAKTLPGDDFGQVKIIVSLHRLYWIAGQQCCVKITIENETKSTIKSLSTSLVRSLVLFKPRPHLDTQPGGLVTDPDACKTTTAHKEVSRSVLTMSHGGMKGFASAKGWWSGVGPGERSTCFQFVPIPTDALTVVRGRLLEIEYSLRVVIRTTSKADIQVALPIRVLNFLSIDPPPSVITEADYLRLMAEGDVLASYRAAFSQPTPTRMPGVGLTNSQETSVESAHSISMATVGEPSPSEIHPRALRTSVIRRGLDRSESESGSSSADESDGYGYSDYSIQSDTEDVVQHAIASARVDSDYGENAVRFSDLYYSSLRGGNTTADESLNDVGNESDEAIRDHIRAGRFFDESPPGSSLSSFAARVQEKLLAVGSKLSSPIKTRGDVLDGKTPKQSTRLFSFERIDEHQVQSEVPPDVNQSSPPAPANQQEEMSTAPRPISDM